MSFATKILATAAIFVAATAAADAQSRRPDTRQMTCEQTRQLIRQRGAVVLTTGQFTYDRYVAGEYYCDTPNHATPAIVRTRDTPQCPVLNCQRQDPFFLD